MPTRNSNFWLLKATRALYASSGSALTLLSAAASVYAQSTQAEPSGDWFSSLFSTYGITIGLVGLLCGLMVFRKIRSAQTAKEIAELKSSGRAPRPQQTISAPATQVEPRLHESLARTSQVIQPAPQSVDFEPSAFGAYRIDQEVNKLVVGKAHRMDVMSSRVADDRRAIEASLVKALDAYDSTDDGRRRAREALEEYGYVARQSALMLLGRDAWERSSAARILGQIGSPSSLTFLIEALHDPDSVVRNQAVSSLGALKMPAAIGALLDIARRDPDIPASLLSESLSACSVESLGYLDSSMNESAFLTDGQPADYREIGSLKSLDELPQGDDDAELVAALRELESADESARKLAAQQVGLYRTQRSVTALTAAAINDSEPAVRSAAVAALGSVDHESVFAPVLIALADESRIVRAAAARTLTSLHFDRADAYVRLLESSDQGTLQHVARACVSTGIVAQAVDRLASEDRHQAHEAFSLFSILAKAKELQPIIDVIENNQDDETRLCAVRVLNVAATSDALPKLREVVSKENVPESVRTSVLEVLFKLEAAPPAIETEVIVDPQVTTTP